MLHPKRGQALMQDASSHSQLRFLLQLEIYTILYLQIQTLILALITFLLTTGTEPASKTEQLVLLHIPPKFILYFPTVIGDMDTRPPAVTGPFARVICRSSI